MHTINFRTLSNFRDVKICKCVLFFKINNITGGAENADHIVCIFSQALYL